MATCAIATSVATTVVTEKTSRKKTIAFARSTRARLGQAVRVVRIMPVPYSEAIVRTPSVITQIDAGSIPKKPKPSADSSPIGAPEPDAMAATPRPMANISRIMTPSVHIVERTERIFVHSEASASPRCAARTGMGET
ncbi:hypothetical protein STANM309S_00073 [Streptomyces tanashiensis]